MSILEYKDFQFKKQVNKSRSIIYNKSKDQKVLNWILSSYEEQRVKIR